MTTTPTTKPEDKFIPATVGYVVRSKVYSDNELLSVKFSGQHSNAGLPYGSLAAARAAARAEAERAARYEYARVAKEASSEGLDTVLTTLGATLTYKKFPYGNVVHEFSVAQVLGS